MKNIFYSEDINFSSNFANFLEAREQKNSATTDVVRNIIEDVKTNKDAAVIKYTKKFDRIDLEKLGLFFEPKEIEESRRKIATKDRAAINLSIARVMDFHKKQVTTHLTENLKKN